MNDKRGSKHSTCSCTCKMRSDTQRFFFSLVFFWKKSHCWIFQQKSVPRKLVHEAINYFKDKEATILQEAKKKETNFPRKRKGVHPLGRKTVLDFSS